MNLKRKFSLNGIFHSSTAGGILDKAIEAEEMVHGDFLRLVILFITLPLHSSFALQKVESGSNEMSNRYMLLIFHNV
jgi:hypothetical protein